MANITMNCDKNGIPISNKIIVYRCRNAEGKLLKPFCMTWKIPAGKTKRQIEKELQAVVIDFENRCKQGLVSADPKLTIEQFVPQYLAIAKNSLSKDTLERYEQTIQRFIIPELGYLKLTDVKPIHIQNFINKLCDTKVQRSAKWQDSERTLSAASITRYMNVVKSIFRQAFKLGLISENPTNSQRLTLPKVATPKIEIFTKQEAQEMLTCLLKEDIQFQVLIQLAIITGARRGELVALKFSDVNFDTHMITIERAAIKLKGQPITTKPPKDYEVRSVTVDDYCIELIKLLKQDKERQKNELCDLWNDEDWLFTQWNGEIMNPQTPTKWFSKFLKRNELQHKKFHSLRHTSATLLLYGGLNIKQVQNRLGHGDITTTNKYLHYIDEADKLGANILHDMLTVK